MSCEGCESDSYQLCPSKMYSNFTDYRPRCVVNSELLGKLSSSKMIESSYESRMYLQQNALVLMEEERKKAEEKLSPCAPCKRPLTDVGTMLPERYVVRCDAVSCSRIEVDKAGLGDGRSY